MYEIMDPRTINIRAFIAEVQKRPAIWDQTCEDYNNKEQKIDDWQELTLMFIPKDGNYTPVEVKSFTSTLQRRWKNLRDCYTRELLRLMKLKASGTVDRKRGYIYFKQLSFLRKVVKPTKRSTDISPNELEVLKNVLESDEMAPQCEDPLEEMETEGTTKLYTEEFQDTHSAQAEEDYTIPPSYVSEIRNSTNTNGVIKPKLHPTTIIRQSKPNQDHDTLFLLSLAKDLQNLPDEQKLDVKIEIMQVLRKAKQKSRIRREYQVQAPQDRVTVKDEAESDSVEDIEEHSLDSIRDPTTPELLEEDNV